MSDARDKNRDSAAEKAKREDADEAIFGGRGRTLTIVGTFAFAACYAVFANIELIAAVLDAILYREDAATLAEFEGDAAPRSE